MLVETIFFFVQELQYETRAQDVVRFAEGVLEACGGVLDDSLRASCISLAKPLHDKIERPLQRPKPSLSSSLTSIPDETQRETIAESVFKRSFSTRRKSTKERKAEKERGRHKRALTQKVMAKEVRKALMRSDI